MLITYNSRYGNVVYSLENGSHSHLFQIISTESVKSIIT